MSPLFKTIVRDTWERLNERRRAHPDSAIQRDANAGPPVRPLDVALANGFSVIAEHKHRSPSGGQMSPDNVEGAYRAYADAPWISAVSVLTDVDHFGGKVEELRSAREAVPGKPILRKDFIVDPYQIYEARAYGADAVLLMAALHADDEVLLARLLSITHDLGMKALVEIGMGGNDPVELSRIVPAHAMIWGINSRRFEGSKESAAAGAEVLSQTGRDPLTSLELHASLRSLIPSDKIAIAESGLHTADDLEAARAAGYQAALIGTAFLKAPGALQRAVQAFGGAINKASEGAYARAPESERTATAAE